MFHHHEELSTISRRFTIYRKSSAISPSREFITGFNPEMDVRVMERHRMRERAFPKTIQALDVLPTQYNWQANPKNEKCLEEARFRYESELILMWTEMDFMPRSLVIMMWEAIQRGMDEENDNRGCTPTIKALRNYRKRFPHGNQEDPITKIIWWEKQQIKEGQERGCCPVGEDEPKTSTTLWTYCSPDKFEARKRQTRYGDWIQESCQQASPAAPVACLMRYSPVKKGVAVRTKKAGEKKVKQPRTSSRK